MLTACQTFNWFMTAGVVTLTSPGDETNNEGDTVSLQVSASDANDSTLTYQASGLPAGLSMNSSGLISGTIATGDSANGPYLVTISTTDSQGYGSSEQFTWNVNAPASVLTVTNPGNQSNAEGDNVSLQIQASDPDGDFLEYTASGLPIGLMIDPMSGLISGTVDYSAAEISGGQYNVTVTVNDGNGDTANQSFVWTIANTPQAPWLEPLDFQNNQTGTSASMQLLAGSPDGNALTYSASGLPSGLSIDPNTGLISGTITAAMGSYTVTATVTDNGNNLSDSQTFTWQVTCGPAPQVLISFDGQPAGEDVVAGVDPATPVPVLVTLEGATPGLHTITLSIPSGLSTLSLSTFQLSDGGSESLEMTPVQESQSFDDGDLIAYVDGQEAGDPRFTNVKVTIAGETEKGDVKNADTPMGMADRIPPVKDPKAANPSPWTSVAVTITPTLKDAEVVVFQVANNGGNNGTVNFLNVDDEARPRIYLQASGNLYLVGMAQTNPGSAGQLSIVAYPGTQEDQRIKTVDTDTKLAYSAGFSVAAIPIAVTMYNAKPTVDPGIHKNDKGQNVYRFSFGAVYAMKFTSDSGNPRDLDQITYLEQLGIAVDAQGKPIAFTGSAKSLLPQEKKALHGAPPKSATGNSEDLNSVPVPLEVGTVFPSGRPVPEARARQASADAMKKVILKDGDGVGKYVQYFVFTDSRTGSKDVLMAHSGFSIEFDLKKTKDGVFVFVIKTPQANNGVTAGEMPKADQAPVKTEVN